MEFDQMMMDLAGSVSGARLWEEAVRQVAQGDCPRRRGQDFLSASGESGQVVVLCLSHHPPVFLDPPPTLRAPRSYRLPARLPLSLCQL